MKKRLFVVVGLSMMLAFMSAATESSTLKSMDELDVILDDPMSLCVDDECSAVWLPPFEPEVTLDTGDVVWIEEKNPETSANEDAILWLSGGDCIYVEDWDGEYIDCEITFPVPNPYYYVAVGKVPGDDAVQMCYWNSFTEEWDVAGWSQFGDAYKLFVEGQDAYGEYIQIIRTEASDDNCPMDNFTNRFDYTVSSTRVLRVRGNGGTDYILGSQYGDSVLSGERVYGREGADKLYLDNDGVTYPVAYGGQGADYIFGTSSVDYAWGDDDGTGVGSGDMIYGYANADQLSGVYGDDTIYGGNDRDYMWGGQGNDKLHGIDGETTAAYDFLYGGDDDDFLFDANTGGTCNGGNETTSPYDYCYCPTISKVDCEW
ncbi:MAG: hypothetical protein M0R80_22490 [Proteobacteria bacterium]|nr:hypothetical protein [Pseudomonadota bacterium]